jgi:hypothetical protein
MAGRRKLVDGIKEKGDRRKEEDFVYGETRPKGETKPKPPRAAPRKTEGKSEPESPVAPLPAANLPALTARTPLTTRVRTDYAAALKRASLERQLSGETPNTVQDILEEALAPWLKDHGYLKQDH